jgi:prepilin-type N-terminal cleavage/methylation domain-containing protein
VKKSNEGFTLAELMIVCTILAVIVVISVVAYQQGAKKQYGLSQQTRSLATALLLARMQALDNQTALKVTDATSIDKTGNYYSKIKLTASNHGVKPGDYVAISGLLLDTALSTATPVSTETPTTGAFYVTAADLSTFDCVYYHSDAFKATSETVARNLTRSSQLIMVKKSWVDTLPTNSNPALDERAAMYKSNQHFVYDDRYYRIWDKSDQGDSTTELATYSPVVGFTSRGFSASESGYELRMTSIPIKDSFKIISVSPFGQVFLGITK